MSLQDKASSCVDQSKFRQQNDARLVFGLKPNDRSFSLPNISFGVPTKPSEPVATVIANVYGEQAAIFQIEHYGHIKSRKQRITLSTKSNNAHRLLNDARKSQYFPELVPGSKK